MCNEALVFFFGDFFGAGTLTGDFFVAFLAAYGVLQCGVCGWHWPQLSTRASHRVVNNSYCSNRSPALQ